VSSTLFGTVNAPVSVVLTWGANPRDLDAHTWIPHSQEASGYREVYYASRGSLSQFPHAYLDRDVTSGYGPEHIKFTQFYSGTSYYSVENWTGTPPISYSSAIVVVKDANGNVITTYNVPTTGTESDYWWHVLSFKATSDGSSANLYTVNSLGAGDPISTSWNNPGSINAVMQGSGNLWTQGTRVETTVTGRYTGHSDNYGIVGTAILHSENDNNANKTTSDGGAYYGVLGAAETNRNINSKVAFMYIDPYGKTGYIDGTLSGTVNASDNTFYTAGPIFSTAIGSGTGIEPKSLYGNIHTYYYPEDYLTGSGSFTAGGTFNDGKINQYLYQRNIAGQHWGIWDTQLGAKYEGTTGSDWNISFSNNYYTYRINQFEVTGTQWSDKTLSGKVYGYGGDASYTENELTGKTWINVGDAFGTYNPNSSTMQSVMVGKWIETNKFLDLVINNQAALQQLNIPCVSVGKADLSGSGNNMTVSMNNVMFFANSSGAAPKIWATGHVNGGYTGTPSTSVPVALSGNGLSANFNIKRWSTTTNNWLATITDGTGNLSGGSYTGAVSFKGVGAGTINQTNNTFSGTAAGTAGPPPVAAN